MADLILIHNVSRCFGDRVALDQINASIPKEKIVGLVGPDAAGKTTLLRLIAGLLLPTQGDISVDGHDTVKDADAIHEMTGYMPQKFSLYENLTVMQNLILYADLRCVPKEEEPQIFDQLLTMTGLKQFVDRFAGDLSGGMKQKLGLACALLGKPRLLLLDEPSVGIDPILRRELWAFVQHLSKEGMTILWSTSYLEEAEKCDTVLLLNEGKLLYQGAPQDLTEKMEGRCFLLRNTQGNRRLILRNTLSQNNVMDGSIQGSEIRFTTKEKGQSIDLQIAGGGSQAEIVPTRPCFEDAFLDILGGASGGGSLLGQKSPKIATVQEIVIKTENLTKKFGDFIAVNQISFQVKKGEVFGLLGPNGAGKSTAFRMICGLLQPTEGSAEIDGVSLQKAGPLAREHIGYMAQRFSLYGDLSVQQNLEFFAGAYNLVGLKKKEIIDEMIETFDLENFLDSNANALPLGFKQRLALSCAVMHRPTVLFLDEPTSGVDPITRREFWNHIHALVERGCTILVTTHFMGEAESCDRIGLIYQSRIIHSGTPDELKQLGKTVENPSPTLEDAFIHLIQAHDRERR